MTPRIAEYSSRSSRGFTMVELMIALTIGLLVTIGILSLLGSMKRTAAAQSGLTTLQDNERIAMNLAADLVQTAGYYPYGSSATTIFPVTAAAPAFATAGQFLTGSTAAGNDSISVRYATAGNTALLDKAIDCTGNTSATAKMYTNTLSISANTLQCSLLVGATTTPVTLVSGICSMTIVYGVQSNPGSTNNSVDAYLSAGVISNWAKVLSVKITMNFANPLANSLTASGCTSTLPQVSFTRVITLMNNTGVDS